MSKGRKAISLVEVLVSIAIVSMIVGLLLPAVQYAREMGRKSHCQANLRTLGLASHSFESAKRRFPGSLFSSDPSDGNYMFDRGTFVELLPYCDQQATYQALDFSDSVFSPENIKSLGDPPPYLLCPSSPQVAVIEKLPAHFSGQSIETSHAKASGYVCNSGTYVDPLQRGTVFFGSIHCTIPEICSSYQYSDLKQGASQTILFWERVSNAVYEKGQQIGGRIDATSDYPGGFSMRGEDLRIVHSATGASVRAYKFAWMGFNIGMIAAQDVTGKYWQIDRYRGFLHTINFSNSRSQPYSRHPGVAGFVMADGSVQFLSEDISPHVLAEMAIVETAHPEN